MEMVMVLFSGGVGLALVVLVVAFAGRGRH